MRLQQILKEKKISQAELSRRSGIARNSISDYLKGKYEAKQDKVYLIAKALNVSEGWLMGFDVSPERSNSLVYETSPERLIFPEKDEQVINAIKIPVLSKISAGLPIYSEQNIIEHAFMPAYLEKPGKEYFYLKVSGDSMDKEFKEGDLVLIEKDCPIESGQIGVVIINGYNATVKRVRYQDDKILLLPESNNPEHLPQTYTMDDTVRCVGKVVSVQKFY
ncbi:helix-turn-helix domain-containing protein [Macrococcus brunensis]|uniref:Helix-turn-helix domain-containing protein n=2 Tax=Macrococcus brunensis TaxID=198483 RepID=A0A4R6BD36_9STAP|nr:helix-turn-helix domain-containing protein [Macrococcus brunensis]